MATPLRTAREPSPSPLSWRAALRPARWAEALLVLAPLVFAGLLADPPSMALALQAALAFALLGAAGDAVRHAADRRRRASAVGAAACAVLGLALAWWVQLRAPPLSGTGPASLGTLDWGALLLGVSLADALLLRLWVPASVAATAVSYVLRAAGGAAALQLLPSRWLVICSFGLGLFVALGRHAWRVTPDTRRAGARRPAVTLAADITAALVAASFVAYALSPETEAAIGSRDLIWTAPLVALVVARHREHIRLSFGRDPFELLLRDQLALGAFMLWITAVLFVIYRPW
jgi:hypothetical protein